jgi:L-aspartate oxidase
VIEHAFLDDVVLEGGRAAGVAVRDATGARRLAADAVVLATGGAGQLYAHTTNPEVATGDGIAAALRAGAHVADLEFVQFHPTVLTLPSGAFLVSEAVRGDGAVLIDDEGRRFAFDAHPDGELAPRDVVARAIARRMRAQDGHPVRLDATALGAEFLAARFPTIDGMIRAAGWDWAREPVPVTPAAHYLMGGVMTDLHGRTSVPGLYAVGEVARTGVHGANRLASNSLLEGAVFGARAGDAIVADASSGAWPRPDDAAFADAAAPLTAPGPSGPAADAAGAPPFSRAALQRLMWEDAGLERTAEGLAHAARILAAWHEAGLPTATVAGAEDADLVLVARAVVAAALARTASVGAHYRADTDAAASAPAATIAEAVAC